MRILQARILEWVAMPSSRGSSQPRDQTQVSHIAGEFLPSEPPENPKNTGVGTLSVLQRILLTQESNLGLLYYRSIVKSVSCVQLFVTPWTVAHQVPLSMGLGRFFISWATREYGSPDFLHKCTLLWISSLSSLQATSSHPAAVLSLCLLLNSHILAPSRLCAWVDTHPSMGHTELGQGPSV